MTTGFVFGKERAIEMDTSDGCAQFRVSGDFRFREPTRFNHVQEILVSSCGGSGEDRGCAVIEMGPAHGQNIRDGGIHKIGTGTSVNVDIDEPRGNETALSVDDYRSPRDTFSFGNLCDLIFDPDNHSIFDQGIRKNHGAVHNGEVCRTGWHAE
jgi:hypothetical protein